MISKLLSKEVFFKYYLEWLCLTRFKNPIEDDLSIETCFEEFARFKDEHFIEVCKLAYKERFLPEINWFLDQRQLILDREYREANVFRPEPPISEEHRLKNVARVQEMFQKFKVTSSF